MDRPLTIEERARLSAAARLGTATRPLPRGTGRRVPPGTTSRAPRGAKPLFVLRRHPRLHRRTTVPVRTGASYVRTFLAGLLGSTLRFMLVLAAGAGGVAWAAWSYVTDGLPAVTDMQITNFQSTKIYDRTGRLLYEISDPRLGKRTYLSIDQLPPDLLNATIAAEDPTFRDNAGVDLRGLLRAVYINLTNKGSSGGSTITMQLVRNVLLPEKDELSMRRKVREAIMANRVSQTYSKDKILEIYLNDIYYGGQAYGVAAAAQVFYGVAAKDLDLAQAAMLAGLPQAPSFFDPRINYDQAKIRQKYVLDQMVRNDLITPEEALQAAAEDVHPVGPAGEIGPSQAPHFVNYVRALLDEQFGPDLVSRGGLRVFTTIDLRFQELAQRTAAAQVDALRADNASNAALTAIDPRTGEILAMLGSVDYSNPDFGQVNVAVAPRQPGSAFKPFTYVTAFKKGYTAATMLADIPTKFDAGPTQPPYAPKNYDLTFRGPVLARQALANSLNVPTVQLMQMVGVADVIDTAHRMGITTLNDDPANYGLALTLGGGEVTLLDLTSAYGTFANRGLHLPAQALLEVRDGQDNVLFHYDPAKTRPVQAISPQQAYLITDILSDNNARTPVFGANSALKVSRQAAAKTGTTENYRDSWTMGYTPDLAVGVWVGNNDGREMTRVAGSRGAGPIWHNFMEGVFADPAMESVLLQAGETVPPQQFAMPPGMFRMAVCAVSGLRPTLADSDLVDELFITGTEPPKECELHQFFKICIDHQDAELANPYCPTQFVIERPYLVLPPAFKEWEAKQPKHLGPPSIICTIHGPEPTATPTPNVTETPVPGLAPPIQITYPSPQPTPVLDDEFPGALVNISSPRPGASVGGEVTITGSAVADAFDYFKLEYRGPAPSGWVAINGQATSPVRSSILGLWNTTGLREGGYTIRLTLVGKVGQTRQYSVPVLIERSTPKVSMTSPARDATFFGGDAVLLAADASGAQGLAGVEFYVDDVRVAVAYQAPYQFTWPATPGSHVLGAVAYSIAGRRTSSESVPITVLERPTPAPTPVPSFGIVYPQDGTTFNGASLPLLAGAGPDTGIVRVDFYVDGWKVASVSGHDTFQAAWQVIADRHTIMAIAYNAGGAEVTRAQITVNTVPGP
ncbi:MAG TPA: PBP1A family penicillin-binding protein [Chloroflexia bacterium]|nr:PBP1A family penicillin-binding protein [Chloroflexia bacterium]